MKTTERLLAAAKDIWAAYNEHPFVLGIQDGILAREKFKYYIIQDYLYLEEYAKVFAIGIAKAKRLDTMRLFSRQVNFLTEGEMDIHRGYIGAFTVSQEELAATPRALDNLSYTSYMLRVAYEEGEAEILAAILSCAYSYEVIAKTAGPEFCDGNVVLLDTLNHLTSRYTEEQLRHLTDIFLACSRYELAFWEMAWNMSN